MSFEAVFEDQRPDGIYVVISTVFLPWTRRFHTVLICRNNIDEYRFMRAPWDHSSWDWDTEGEAIDGHDVILAAYREDLDPDVLVKKWKEKYRLQEEGWQ